MDPTVYEARLAQDQANLAQAHAQVEQAQARLVQARSELTRSSELAKREMISPAELETATANRDSLEAQLKMALASVEQAQALLRLSKANLDYTTIRSPVSGVVIARNVNEGQTVVASMSAQVLFLIAADLKQVQVEASISEADIGKIKLDQPVKFTVDAHDRPFEGSVSQIRLAAAIAQNVVTYPVVIRAENPDLILFPSMTVGVSCEVARRSNALKAPNAALRFRPEEAAIGKEPGKKTAVEKSAGDNAAAGEHGRGRRPSGGEQSDWGRSAGKVWIRKTPGAAPEPIVLSLGISDGSFTEVLEPAELKEGQEVITGYAVPGAGKQADIVNPFAPPTPPGMRRAAR
ncbi:MAG: efflux RND transporter periplasmic adaptor subunit [Verrucomicrobiota bacterium]|nr:efflux RND transporter periplasmic adaptor subunit [Verrucomicrobiota bacterium]